MLDVPQLLQIFFLSAVATLLLVNSIPGLRTRYVAYGPRATPAWSSDANATIEKDDKTSHFDGSLRPILEVLRPVLDVLRSIFDVFRTIIDVLIWPLFDVSMRPILDVLIWPILDICRPENLRRGLDLLATLQVPHGYFQHFYIVSVCSSVFWALQFITKGRALELICQNAPPGDPSKSMSVDQIVLTWSLMSIQGVRRLLETSILAKPSTSKMWFVHWLLGIAFYLAMGVSVWIEGAGKLITTESPVSGITRSAPSLKTMLSIPIFILASGIQHDCHAYLASLPKYTLPMHPMFQVLVCPHYTAECLIYLSLAILSAPRGAVVNKTMFTALIFVSTNLAVTASMSKGWYERKFGKEAVAHRWKMITSLY